MSTTKRLVEGIKAIHRVLDAMEANGILDPGQAAELRAEMRKFVRSANRTSRTGKQYHEVLRSADKVARVAVRILSSTSDSKR